jgi:hypothetical protein
MYDQVDPALLQLLESVDYPGYEVEFISGYRPKTPKNPRSRHGRGGAIDVELVDQKSGRRVPNYQNAEAFKIYQDYANRVYQHALQNNPELAQKLAWGGYFSGPKGKYGALDLMHFDTGGMQAGGDWESGLTPQQAKLWGLEPGGGISGQPPAPPTQAQQYNLPPLDPLGAFPQAEAEGANNFAPAGPVEAAGGGAGSEAGQTAPVAPAGPPAAPKRDFWSTFAEGAAKGLGKMGGTGGGFDYKVPAAPGPARVDVGVAPMIDPQRAEAQRQALAMAMARLNQGSLW